MGSFGPDLARPWQATMQSQIKLGS